jgi:acyl-CoA synthetase (NDP forming)
MHDLARLLRPKSIAVIGGGTWCANVIEQCEKIGFCGEIWPVHPKHDQLAGRKAYAHVNELPRPPDASFVGVNRTATVKVVAALSAANAGGAVCFASGFKEAASELADGNDLQSALLEAAGNMPILGPNCYGMINCLDGAALWPDQHGAIAAKRGVALITQSSNIAINLTMQMRALPLSYVITAGNQAQMGLAEIAQGLLEDDRVTAIGLHIEGIGDLRAFEALAKAAQEKGVPIVALKVGRSEQAQAATISHTASLAGSDAGARAFLTRLGIGQARSLDGFLEALKLLHVIGPLACPRIASMSCSGGEASVMADSAVGTALSFPALNETQQIGLRAALGPKVALANPLDYHTYIWGDEAALAATFTAMMAGDLGLGLVVLDFPRSDRCDPSAWSPVIKAVKRAQEVSGKPIAILSSLPETLPESTAFELISLGVLPLCGICGAMEAIEIGASLRSGQREPVLLPPICHNPVILHEAESKAALAKFGVQIPKGGFASSIAEATGLAQQMQTVVALKGSGIAHKTEAGAVALNLSTPQAVKRAAQAMPTNEFYVEEMICDTVAELRVGVTCDPAHGYVLTLAAGGVLTELLEDSTSLLVPASEGDIRAALASLKVNKLLLGYRGQPAADIDPIVKAVQSVQAYVTAALPDEVEINPLLCGPARAVAADALIKIGET